MSLLIGQPITGRELEQITSEWSPEYFASMCDVLVWAASLKLFYRFLHEKGYLKSPEAIVKEINK